MCDAAREASHRFLHLRKARGAAAPRFLCSAASARSRSPSARQRRLQQARVVDRQRRVVRERLRQIAIFLVEGRRRLFWKRTSDVRPIDSPRNAQRHEEQAMNPDRRERSHDPRTQRWRADPRDRAREPAAPRRSRSPAAPWIARRCGAGPRCARAGARAQRGRRRAVRKEGESPPAATSPRRRAAAPHTAILDHLGQALRDHVEQALIVGRRLGERAQRDQKNAQPILESTNPVPDVYFVAHRRILAQRSRDARGPFSAQIAPNFCSVRLREEIAGGAQFLAARQ